MLSLRFNLYLLKKLKKLILFFFMIFSSSIYAANTPPKVPANLHIYSAGGGAYVDMTAHGCSGNRYFLSPDHIKYDTIISIILAAQLSERKVVLRYSGCVNDNNPQGNIIGVYLK